ncbi:hypothetical protein ACVWWQ_002098 [Rhodanobacter sp. TND4EL1]
MRRVLLACLVLIITSPLAAAELNLTVQIREQKVAEYHRPYAAIWIERADHSVAAQLAVWYAQKDSKEGAGSKWLPDLRQWWRRGGREISLPVDGVSGATRPAGQHQLKFASGQAPLGTLAAGDYTLVVEAAREVGGREVVRVPFSWPGAAPQHLAAQGSSELGAVSLDINP